MLVLYMLFSCAFSLCFALNKTTTKPPLAEDDYYSVNYDYEINSNNNNKTIASKNYAVDVLPSIELPDDSLADPDLKDHNCIDNIMYVYYGGNGKSSNAYGSGVIIIGSVMSCVAQLLTILCILIKRYYKGKCLRMLLIVIHIFATMFLANLCFMLGVYKTKQLHTCFIVSILTNILHHETALWIFIYCFYIYKQFSPNQSAIFNSQLYLLAVQLLPISITMTTYYIDPRSFETDKFCFKSMHQGMIFNFMIPMCILLVLTTFYAICSMVNIVNLETSHLQIKAHFGGLNKKDSDQRDDSYITEDLYNLKTTKNCLKNLCALQLIFVLSWFITPMALEDSHNSSGLAFLQCLSSMVLNWFVFYKKESFLPNLDFVTMEKDELATSESSTDATEMLSVASSDSTPLLKSDADKNATELKDFSIPKEDVDSEYICTISA